ncbi:PTS system mannose/fructose-specific component IIA [Candidatus Vecturithrix granuli]|uniref:PTS system mannose/fructose-specific component IIA n=1 Tax=Vecturithrix granuli TaxID=1499967 RepID=A0A081BXR4_VECG1|nr:PTS system mannose/fructose-specific component IIA [Candidatus Vecturithrix granuli]
MVGGVIVSHGQLGKELIATAEMIVGKIPNITSVSIDVTSDVETSREQIRQAIKSVNNGAGVVIFTDMFGGTPSNISLSFLDEANIEVITGVNLAMLLQLSTSGKAEPFQQIVQSLKQRGQENIHIASEFLKQRGKK